MEVELLSPISFINAHVLNKLAADFEVIGDGLDPLTAHRNKVRSSHNSAKVDLCNHDLAVLSVRRL
jgi:hypothetical protein